jgi:chitodextrinase
MLKGEIALTATRPTRPTVPGGGDTTPPSVPSNLRATAHTSTSVTLAWNPATDDGGVTGYRVLRVSGSAGTQIGTATGTSYTVVGLAPSTAYTFAVAAFDAAGNVSQSSNPVSATTDAALPDTDLALGRPTAESSHTQSYVSGNAVDADPNSYWESANDAFPQWLQVDLGAASSVMRIVLTLPPSSAWGRRTQTISVHGSGDGAAFSRLLDEAGHTFDPATGNRATLTLPSAVTTRYVRLTFTANTGWPAGQVSGLQVYAS